MAKSDEGTSLLHYGIYFDGKSVHDPGCSKQVRSSLFANLTKSIFQEKPLRGST
jgi:hypothetical protein